MQNLVRNKREVYIASRVEDSDPVTYNNPVKYYLNCYPISSTIGLQTLGITYTEYMKAKTNITTIKEGDGAYINKKPESTFNILGHNLEYIVESVVSNINETEIMFKRKVGV